MQVDVMKGTPGVSQGAIDFVVDLAKRANVTVDNMYSDWHKLSIGVTENDGSRRSYAFIFPLDEIEATVHSNTHMLYFEREFFERINELRMML